MIGYNIDMKPSKISSKGNYEMTNETREKLAASLTAETTELIPFLPYLLQDFWEIGSEPSIMIGLLKEYADLPKDAKVLDLACGKGAVSVKMAHQLGFQIKGIDIIPDFVKFALEKADEYNVGHLCEFGVGEINEAVMVERDYDVVILGAVGNVLGDPAETLQKLKSTIKVGGYILIDECYLPDDGSQDDVQYKNYEFLSQSQWANLFKDSGLILVKAITGDDLAVIENPDSKVGMAHITKRAKELISKHPEKKPIFEGYINSQQAEYDDLDNNLAPVVWLLRKM